MSDSKDVNRLRVPFTELIDLASEMLDAKVLAANDDFFAPKEALIKAAAPIFLPEKYIETGKWMDGWESRRKRQVGAGNDRDWCVIKLGATGFIRGVNVDTAHFLGNNPEYCSLDALCAPDLEPAMVLKASPGDWREILPKARLCGGTQNLFPIADANHWTHVRLNIFPDGGVARLRVHGEIKTDWKQLKSMGGMVDLAAAQHGAEVVTCNDMFFGHKDNLILPNRAKTMGEGWETRRRRGPGNDWIVIRLAGAGKIKKIEIDTNHFKGNFPESASVDGCVHGTRDLLACDLRDRTDLVWREVLPRTVLKADTRHFFEKELRADAANQKFDYLRLNVFPDGGISRFRAFGVVE